MAVSSKLLAKVCHYYYRDQLTMAEIGRRLEMSRHRVGRLLREAMDRGVVRIDIRAPSVTSVDLESRLEAAFGLKASVVVECEDEPSDQEIKRRTCASGAQFIRDLIQEDSTIGVGWGSTTFELVNQLEARRLGNVTVVQITGGNKWLDAQFDCQEVTRRLAGKLGVHPVLLHAPGLVDRKETRELLLNDSSIASTFRVFGAIDVAIVGIGALVPEQSSTLAASGYISSHELETLKRAGAVGDVFSYFFDDRGRLVRTDLYERLVTIGIDQMRRVPTSIGVATGVRKARAVAAAARGGFVNTLIVDSGLARALLARSAGAPRGEQRGEEARADPEGIAKARALAEQRSPG